MIHLFSAFATCALALCRRCALALLRFLYLLQRRPRRRLFGGLLRGPLPLPHQRIPDPDPHPEHRSMVGPLAAGAIVGRQAEPPLLAKRLEKRLGIVERVGTLPKILHRFREALPHPRPRGPRPLV